MKFFQLTGTFPLSLEGRSFIGISWRCLALSFMISLIWGFTERYWYLEQIFTKNGTKYPFMALRFLVVLLPPSIPYVLPEQTQVENCYRKFDRNSRSAGIQMLFVMWLVANKFDLYNSNYPPICTNLTDLPYFHSTVWLCCFHSTVWLCCFCHSVY